jgi:hypothetical protein
MELVGLFIGFFATIVIVIGDKILQSFGFCIDEADPFDPEDYEEMVEGK